jgi:hypothetical protein
MTENDYIAEYVKERHPNILGADYGLWKTGRMIANVGKGIILAFRGLEQEDIDKFYDDDDEDDDFLDDEEDDPEY